MKILETAIAEFNDWSHPWRFYECMCNAKELSDVDIELFRRIWTEANDSEIWNNADWMLACNASHHYIKENFDLTDESISSIVRAISYDWK